MSRDFFPLAHDANSSLDTKNCRVGTTSSGNIFANFRTAKYSS